MAGDLDAYLTFEDGWYGKSQSKRLDVYGETKDVFENEFGSIQIDGVTYEHDVVMDSGTEAFIGHEIIL